MFNYSYSSCYMFNICFLLYTLAVTNFKTCFIEMWRWSQPVPLVEQKLFTLSEGPADFSGSCVAQAW